MVPRRYSAQTEDRDLCGPLVSSPLLHTFPVKSWLFEALWALKPLLQLVSSGHGSKTSTACRERSPAVSCCHRTYALSMKTCQSHNLGAQCFRLALFQKLLHLPRVGLKLPPWHQVRFCSPLWSPQEGAGAPPAGPLGPPGNCLPEPGALGNRPIHPATPAPGKNRTRGLVYGNVSPGYEGGRGEV